MPDHPARLKKGEYRYFYVTPLDQETEQALLSANRAGDIFDVAMQIHQRAGCLEELIDRMTPEGTVSGLAVKQLGEDFGRIREKALAISQLCFRSAWKTTDVDLRRVLDSSYSAGSDE